MKTALVVSGGGARGAFAVGVIKKLREFGKDFDIVAGTSTGALIAPLATTGEIGLLEQIYATAETVNIIGVNRGLEDGRLNALSIHTAEGLRDLINEHITEERYEHILNSDKELFVVTVSLESGKTFHWNPKRGKDGSPLGLETFRKALFASASMPILVPPVEIDGEHHVDGGVREIAPLKIAVDEGAEAIYAIVLEPEQRASRPLKLGGILPIKEVALRTIGAFTQEVLANDVDVADLYNKALIYHRLLREKAAKLLDPGKVEALFEDSREAPNPFKNTKLINLYKIQPDEELPVSALEFIPERMREMIRLGEQVAEREVERGPLPSSMEVFNQLLAEMRGEQHERFLAGTRDERG